MAPLTHLGIREMAAGFAARRFSPSDVMAALDAHIAAWEPDLCALYAYDAEAARDAAAASTRRWHEGRSLGTLDGVPVTIKEMIATRGTPTPMGTAATLLAPAAADAPPAARLREAGAVIFAKTTAPDYGMLSSGLSSFHALARNPWDLRVNPGGSSAGAAAAAAVGYGPLHVGTDIGGSIRLPASWCGLVGFKPSLGRIPIDPYYLGRCAGPMSRSVDDAAWAMTVLAQPDARDATSLPPAATDWHARLDGVAGLRIGLMLDAGCGMAVDPAIAAAVSSAADLFAASGAVVRPVRPVLDCAMLAGIDDFWRARTLGEMQKLPDERRLRVLAYVRTWAEGGAAVSGTQAVAGLNRIYEIKRSCAALFENLDAVLSPVAPNLFFPAEWASPLDDPARPFDHIGFTLPWNMSEQPAISLNCGFAPDGAPIGLQIVTARYADQLALQLARWFEERRGDPIAWPMRDRARALPT